MLRIPYSLNYICGNLRCLFLCIFMLYIYAVNLFANIYYRITFNNGLLDFTLLNKPC